MSTVLEHKPEVFESVNYFDKRRLTNAAKRWVWFPLDVIPSERKSELSWLRVGGEETSCPCLQKYGRGFVPRGRAALLEMGGEPIPMRHMGDLSAVAWQGLPTDSHTTTHNFAYVPVYPGDGLRLLKRYANNDGGAKKGLDELETLQGVEWEEAHTDENDGILDVVEMAQFGDGISLTLRGLEEQIQFAKPITSLDYGKLRDEQLKLCEDARNWATRKISIEHGLLKLGHVGEWQGGHSYSYSPIVEMLIEQLELKRQDQPIQEMADMVSQIIAKTSVPQGGGMSAADFDFLMDQKLAKVREADAREIAELKAKLAEKETPTEIFKCDTCGQEAGSLAGLKAHQRARHTTEE